jgi:hypothetical protein
MVGRGWMARAKAVDGSHEAKDGGGSLFLQSKNY